MINLSTIDSILKNVYLGVAGEQIDRKTSPFYNKIEKNSQNIYGKEAVFVYRQGINGGVSCGTEVGDLPKAVPGSYMKLTAPLKNIYGTIELSDKSIRATQADASVSGMVSILNQEMESIVESAKFNLNRMLYQSGDGLLGTVSSVTANTVITGVSNVVVDTVNNFVEGMKVTAIKATASVSGVVTKVLSGSKTVWIATTGTIAADSKIYLADGKDNEIFGLPHIFEGNGGLIYGNDTATSQYLKGFAKTATELSCDKIQEVLDEVEMIGSSSVDFIIASYDMRRKYLEHLKTSRTNIDYMNLDGGFNALSYNGIPIYTDRFANNSTMFFLNTNNFKLAQLGDWSWLEGNKGNVLHQVASKPAYTATIVKYCNLMCTQPNAQGKLTVSA